MSLEQYYLFFVLLQLLHSQEEIYTKFYEHWPVKKMSKKFFVTFEIIFSLIIIAPILYKDFPLKEYWMHFFILLMFANGVEHLFWWGSRKEYIPGLYTGLLFLGFFVYYYFNFLVIL